MIVVKQSVSVAATYGLKICLFDDVDQRVVAYFYDEALAVLAARALNHDDDVVEYSIIAESNHA